MVSICAAIANLFWFDMGLLVEVDRLNHHAAIKISSTKSNKLLIFMIKVVILAGSY